ncbi:hypothetical protein ACWGDT_25535 [Streptomyces avermitilis]
MTARGQVVAAPLIDSSLPRKSNGIPVTPNGALHTRLPGALSSDQRNLLSVAMQGHVDEFRWPFIRKNGTWLMRAFLLLQY